MILLNWINVSTLDLRELKMSSLINKSALKKYILAQLKAKRPHLEMTRVSSDALARYESSLKVKILADIKLHPTKGKTFNPEWS